jgi:hypothetical protein
MTASPAPVRPKPLLSWAFGLTLAGWAAVAITGLVGFAWIIGITPTPSLAAPLAGLYLAAPLALWLWGASMAFRGSWRAALVRSACVIVAAVALFVLADPLLNFGAYLRFDSEQAVYAEILQKVRADQPPPSRDAPAQWRGIRYRVERVAPPRVDFIWSDDRWSTLGVAYDEADFPREPAKPQSPTSFGQPSALLRKGGFGYVAHLGGHFCLLQMIG